MIWLGGGGLLPHSPCSAAIIQDIPLFKQAARHAKIDSRRICYRDCLIMSSITAPDTASLPSAISGPSAWYGPDMLRDQSWRAEITVGEIAEVEAATAYMSGNPDLNI